MNDTFLQYLETGHLHTYRINKRFKKGPDMVFENETNMGFKHYAVDDFYCIAVDVETNRIFTIGVYVWHKDFISFVREQLSCVKLTLRKVLDYLDRHSLDWQIEQGWSFDKQVGVRLQSGVSFIFSVDKRNDMVLRKISIAFHG